MRRQLIQVVLWSLALKGPPGELWPVKSNRTRIVVTRLPFLIENVEMNKQTIRFLPARREAKAEFRACFNDEAMMRIAALLQQRLILRDRVQEGYPRL